MNDAQYKALLNLFNEYHEAFILLPNDIQAGFYNRLYNSGY